MKQLPLCVVAMMAIHVHGGTVTNFTLVSIHDQVVTKQISLRAGESLGLLQYFGNYDPQLFLTYENVRVSAGGLNSTLRDKRIQGPGVVDISLVELSVPDGYYRAIISLDIGGVPTPEGTPVVNIPSNAVVIPADSAGPVQVLLESSADLITWNAALPGTYGTSTTNRFFRVRTLRSNP
jgi:hypothetical protein